MPWSSVALIIAAVAARCVIFGIVAYAVFWLDRSGWWFCLAVPLMGLVPTQFRYQLKPEGGA